MKKYQILFTLFIVSLYSLIVYVDTQALVKNKKAYLRDLNMSLIDFNKTLIISSDEFYHTSYKSWGLKKSYLLEKREEDELKQLLLNKSKNDTSLTKEEIENFKLTNRVICLGKKCWEFMGIIKNGNDTKVSLLSKEKNAKLETFKVGDELLVGLKITKIDGTQLFVEDYKKQESFKLKLFDIDVLRYLPKKVKKKDINE